MTRLQILKLLMQGPRHVGEINAVLQIEQSLLSHHLRVLRDANLVTAARDGKAVLYTLPAGVYELGSSPSINLGCCRLSFD